MDWESFKDYFRLTWSESILKRFRENGKCCMEKVVVALNICERRLLTLDEAIEQFGEATNNALVTDEVWSILTLSNKQVQSTAEGQKILQSRWFREIASLYIQYGQNTAAATDEASIQESADYKYLQVRVDQVLKMMEERYPQFKLNGSRNLWIVKPGQRSRGRGIEVYNNLDDILKHMKTAQGGK